MFVAREKGPELVGTIKGHTGVMNNDQIVASVSAGVAKAIMGLKVAVPTLAYTGQNQGPSHTVRPSDNTDVILLLRQLIAVVKNLDLEVSLDGEKIKNDTVKRINNHTRATGQLELII